MTLALARFLRREIYARYDGRVTMAAAFWGVHPRTLRRVLRGQPISSRICDKILAQMEFTRITIDARTS